MSDNDKHHGIKDYIIQVAAGLTVLIIGLLCAIIPKVLSFFLNLFSSIWRLLVSPVSLPLGILVILIILSLFAIAFPIKNRLDKRSLASSNEPLLSSYKEDIFFGVIWRWSNIVDKNPSHDLWCFCPNDYTRLVVTENNNYQREITETTFHCETCGFTTINFGGNRDYALSRVARQIERRINTNEWKDVVKGLENREPK